MKYTVFLVSCGLLAFKVHGLSSVVPHGSEEQFPEEVDQFVDILRRARSSEESGCSGDDSTEAKDKCGKKNSTEVETPAKENQALDNDIKDQFNKSVDKILHGVKLILVDNVPLLYGRAFKCGRRCLFKCGYTTNNETDDDWFYGYQTIPGQFLLNVTDAIDSLVSSDLLMLFASSIDQQMRKRAEEENVTNIITETEGILEKVQSIVYRDADSVPEKFVCGFQVRKKMECSYDNPEEIFGFELDLNDRVKRMAKSRKFRRAVIKFAKEGSGLFPALRNNLEDEILAILREAK